MKFIKVRSTATKDALISQLSDNESTNRNVKFDDEKRGKPHIRVKQNGDKLTLRCQYLGGASKDNGFLEGTYFKGKIKECDGYCEISGIAVTAPIFHFLMLVLIGVFIYQCITLGGISPIPICIVIFDIFMFWGEFKKQGIIERYIARAARRAEQTK
jgi:hypothetical protein